MKFKEIASRLTGISCPVFGVSWNPSQSHVTVARKVISFLEDRRVLYNPYHMEDPNHCVQSVIEIRRFLTTELGNLTDDDGLPQSLRAMLASCRKFLDTVQGSNRRIIVHSEMHSGPGNWVFNSALGELRGIIGIHVAAQHRLDVNGDLVSILPPSPDA